MRRNNDRLHPTSGGKVNIDFVCFLSCANHPCPPVTVKICVRARARHSNWFLDFYYFFGLSSIFHIILCVLSFLADNANICINQNSRFIIIPVIGKQTVNARISFFSNLTLNLFFFFLIIFCLTGANEKWRTESRMPNATDWRKRRPTWWRCLNWWSPRTGDGNPYIYYFFFQFILSFLFISKWINYGKYYMKERIRANGFPSLRAVRVI